MKKTILTSLTTLGLATLSQAAIIAVIDGGTTTMNTTIIDKSTDGNSAVGITGNFTTTETDFGGANNGSYNDDFSHLNTGTNGTTGTTSWTFNNLTIGTYDVYVSWRNIGVNSAMATSAQYNVNGGADVFKNHAAVPDSDLVINDGTNDQDFSLLGQVTVAGGGSISVVMSERASATQGGDFLYNDAAAIVKSVPEPSSTALLGLSGLALILRRRK